MKNKIYLKRKNKILIEKGSGDSRNPLYVVTILKNIEDLGYTFSRKVIDTLSTFSKEELEKFYLDLVNNLKEMVGANVDYTPMYPNFPKQVMDIEESKLYLNALVHYLTFGQVLPKYKKEERLPLFEGKQLKVIEIGDEKDFVSIFKNLISSKTSISQRDKEDIEWFIKNYKDSIITILPCDIPLKENIALITYLLLKYTDVESNFLSRYFKTSTDVLRLAVAMSDGDISLATNTYFKSFKRKERRLILSLLNNLINIEEDMVKYKNRWIRLGERLHPSEYRKIYPYASEAFYKIRNNKKIETYNSKINKLIDKEEYQRVLELLKQRPGEFARKLDYLLRVCSNPNLVINEFKTVAKDVSTPVLLQVMKHFKHRNEEKDIRVFFPKGNIGKAYGIENKLPQINKNICQNIVKICEYTLANIFKNREFLGKVYIDENLRDYIVPFSQRSASKGLKTIVRGSKLNMSDDINTIRAFIYWKEGLNDRTDIDLSAVMYDKDWNYIEHISYTNLKSSKYKACHSGDITAAPNGASEFIDLDIESIKQYNGKYVVLSINSFTNQPFIDIPKCFMGWMSRKEPNSGEIYEPKTIENKIDITANTSVCIPMILDLYENKVIWTDIALKSNPHWYNNVEGNQRGMVLMGKAFTNILKPSLYELFDLHANARGIKCNDINEADTIFALECGITPFDGDIIVSEFL